MRKVSFYLWLPNPHWRAGRTKVSGDKTKQFRMWWKINSHGEFGITLYDKVHRQRQAEILLLQNTQKETIQGRHNPGRQPSKLWHNLCHSVECRQK